VLANTGAQKRSRGKGLGATGRRPCMILEESRSAQNSRARPGGIAPAVFEPRPPAPARWNSQEVTGSSPVAPTIPVFENVRKRGGARPAPRSDDFSPPQQATGARGVDRCPFRRPCRECELGLSRPAGPSSFHCAGLRPCPLRSRVHGSGLSHPAAPSSFHCAGPVAGPGPDTNWDPGRSSVPCVEDRKRRWNPRPRETASQLRDDSFSFQWSPF
jgi:hypothetical protein